MFGKNSTFGSGDSRTTERVYPDEVYDAKEVHKEREIGDEPYHAIRRWSLDVRRKVKKEKPSSAPCDTNLVLLFSAKAFCSERVESSTHPPDDEVYA